MARYYQFTHNPEPGENSFFEMLGADILTHAMWPDDRAARASFIAKRKYCALADRQGAAGATHLTIDIESLLLILRPAESNPSDEDDALLSAMVAGECMLNLMGMYEETGEFSLGAIVSAYSQYLQTKSPTIDGRKVVNHSERYIRDCLEKKGPALHICALVRWIMDVGTEDAHSLLVDMSVRGLAVAEAFRQTLVKIETDRTAAGKYSARNDRGRWPPTLLSPREMFQPPEVITQELWWPGHPRLANPMSERVRILEMKPAIRDYITQNRKTPLK